MLQQSLQDGNMVQNRTRQLSFDYNKVTQKFWRTAHLIHLQNSHAMEIEKKMNKNVLIMFLHIHKEYLPMFQDKIQLLVQNTFIFVA